MKYHKIIGLEFREPVKTCFLYIWAVLAVIGRNRVGLGYYWLWLVFGCKTPMVYKCCDVEEGDGRLPLSVYCSETPLGSPKLSAGIYIVILFKTWLPINQIFLKCTG